MKILGEEAKGSVLFLKCKFCSAPLLIDEKDITLTDDLGYYSCNVKCLQCECKIDLNIDDILPKSIQEARKKNMDATAEACNHYVSCESEEINNAVSTIQRLTRENKK